MPATEAPPDAPAAPAPDSQPTQETPAEAPSATEAEPPRDEAAPPVSEPPPAPPTLEPAAAPPQPTAAAPSLDFLEALRARDQAKLTIADYQRAAEALGGVEWEAIAAVAKTEAERGAYGPDGRPTVLFERHKFRKFTNGAHDHSHPDLSNADAGGYGSAEHAHAWSRVTRAYALDPEAALRATSWGQFQMMGFNFPMTHCKNAHELVLYLTQCEANQLAVFMDFVRHEELIDALKRRDWAAFAFKYNGKDYAKNKYDERMARHYAELRGATAYVIPQHWRLAKSLAKLRAQVDAKCPGRSKASDGDIGDAAHAAKGEDSDHNAYIVDGDMPVVTAIDITNDSEKCSARALADALVASRDRRVKYIIFNRQIVSSYPARGVPAWTWRPYGGDNPHDKHLHISVGKEPGAYDEEAPWQV